MVNEKSILVMNALIGVNNDRIEGFDTALRETQENDLKMLFAQSIQTSEECKTQLRNEVLILGGTPVVTATTGGMLFSVWSDVKSALSRQDHKGVLNAFEDGENVALDAYTTVLKNRPDDITTPQRTLLHAQHQLINNDRDKIRELHDRLITV